MGNVGLDKWPTFITNPPYGMQNGCGNPDRLEPQTLLI